MGKEDLRETLTGERGTLHADFKNPGIAAIVPAAGSGSRMGGERPKQFLELAGVPILIRTLQRILSEDRIGFVAVPVPTEHALTLQTLCQNFLAVDAAARVHFVSGGATRQDSVRAGLALIPAEYGLILVHDGARPLVSCELIRRCLDGALAHGAVIAAVEVKDTLKTVDSEGRILHTVSRDGLWQAQTPQVAWRELLESAFARAGTEGFSGTDEASLLEWAGTAVHIVAGEERNIKITRPGDLQLAERLLQGPKEVPVRIGHGYDVHRLVAGRELILGGVNIPHSRGLLGHSDADVLCHALMDGLLGAAGLGDIGLHFPDSDPQYRGISSLQLLARVMERITARSLRPGNIDCTIICQQPRLRPHIDAMRSNIATVCRIDPESCNIKATTTEGLGFAGREEGIAAHSVVTLIRDPQP